MDGGKPISPVLEFINLFLMQTLEPRQAKLKQNFFLIARQNFSTRLSSIPSSTEASSLKLEFICFLIPV